MGIIGWPYYRKGLQYCPCGHHLTIKSKMSEETPSFPWPILYWECGGCGKTYRLFVEKDSSWALPIYH